MGHYSNPAPQQTGADRSPDLDLAPAAAPRQAQRRLRGADIDMLVERYRVGATINQLAEQFAINRTTVMAHLKRQNVERCDEVRKLLPR